MLPSYFDYIFVHLRQKSTSQARIKLEKFYQLYRPEPDPKSLARLTTLGQGDKVLINTEVVWRYQFRFFELFLSFKLNHNNLF